MMISAVPPAVDADMFLAGAQFSDAFSVVVDSDGLMARDAAEAMLARSPRWATALVRLRDIIVAPLGLTTTAAARRADIAKVGFFPLLSETPARVIAGFDDYHLDFRVIIDVVSGNKDQRIIATTIVLTHNWLGRAYMAVITPFHRLVVRSMLRQAADTIATRR